jgi:protein-L-isoaspartate(D-aspartate) O-methyltransferase
MGDDDRARERQVMVTRQLQDRGVRTVAVLDAFRVVPRERFVPASVRARAYDDRPLEIGDGQTISQPYIVGLMVEALDLKPTDRVLEIGAGSGYAAAIVSRLCRQVVAVERIPEFAKGARERLAALGYDNIEVVAADGTLGWASGAPFDAILVSAAAAHVPDALIEQLAPGGRLLIPIGPTWDQELFRVDKDAQGELTRRSLGGVRFVPLVGS